MDNDEYQYGANKARQAKEGRRARKEDVSLSPPAVDQIEDTVGVEEEAKIAKKSSSKSTESKVSTRGKRAVSGWNEDSKNPLGIKRRSSKDDFEDQRLRVIDTKDDTDDNDIPLIPELEEQTNLEDDLTTRVAVAPSVAVNRVATYRELDDDLLRHASFLTLDGDIDLKLLTRGLSSEAEIVENDELWDWDQVFTEVTSQLILEQESTDQSADKAIFA